MGKAKRNIEEFFEIFHPHIPSFRELMRIQMEIERYNPRNSVRIINIRVPENF